MALARGTAHTWSRRFRRLGFAATVAAVNICCTLGITGTAHAQAAPSVLWGAWVDGVPWDASKLSTFEANTKGVSIIHFGEAWYRDGSYQPFFSKDYQTVRDHGSIPMVDWGSWDVSVGVNQPNFRLSTIANGTHDAHIAKWAAGAAAWGHPLFLRFDWEMNGWWQFPWAEQTNGNEPGDYVTAWRHIHDIFIQQGATNVTWVWCPNISSEKTTSLRSLYPGDDYVDWTCMDGYNFGSERGNQWQSFQQIFAGSANNANHNTYQELLDLAPSKPIMIGETATARAGGDPSAWITDALSQQLPANFPQVKALVWFNWNGGDSSLSWPIESSPSTQSAFGANIRSSYFASNQFGSLEAHAVTALGNLPAAPVAGLLEAAAVSGDQ
jgi:hypothetical protein